MIDFGVLIVPVPSHCLCSYFSFVYSVISPFIFGGKNLFTIVPVPGHFFPSE